MKIEVYVCKKNNLNDTGIFISLPRSCLSPRSLFTRSNSLPFLEFYTSGVWVERFAHEHAQKQLFNDDDLIII